MKDPLHEDKDSPAKGITHRYPDRVLFLVSNSCAMYCRHCTRKRKVGDPEQMPSKQQIIQGIRYIENHREIRDVLLSGGDPLMLPDEYLDWILTELNSIPHVEVVRIGSRIPVVLPYRITDELVDMLKKHHPLWLNTQFNHPRELTLSSQRSRKKTCRRRHPAWKPIRAACRSKRLPTNHQKPQPKTRPKQGPTILPVPMRPLRRT